MRALRAAAARRFSGVTVEALRLFFPLAALHAALWPVAWVAAGLVLPGGSAMPAHLWHGQEMVFGAYGAALLGFILSAMPEWTGTARLEGRALLAPALAWLAARLCGATGAEALVPLAAALDAVLFGGLALYAAHLAWTRPAARLWAFALWLGAFAACAVALRVAFLLGDPVLASRALFWSLLVFLVLLGLALARILPVVLNLALDPARETTPFRPHPGRRHLAPGLVAIALAGEMAGLSPAVQGFLLLGAGAAFLDRLGDAFIGRAAFRPEVLGLAGSAALSGLGLGMMGLDRLDLLPLGSAGLHVVAMGGLGLAVMGVFAVAGLLHTGQALHVPWPGRVALALVPLAVLLRAAPAAGLLPGSAHAAASLAWAAAFLFWLAAYWPALSDPKARPHAGCE